MNWLMAWLGQAEIPVEDADVAPEPAETPVVAQSKVQWLTLLPSVPAYESLLVSGEASAPAVEVVEEKAAPEAEPAPADPTARTDRKSVV